MRRHLDNPVQRSRHFDSDDVVVRGDKPVKIKTLVLLFFFLAFGHYLYQSRQSLSHFLADVSSLTGEVDVRTAPVAVEKSDPPTQKAPANQSNALAVELIRVIRSEATEEISRILAGVDSDSLNQAVKGMTPLMTAAAIGNTQIVNLLLVSGADPNQRGSANRTALQYAVEKNHIDAATLLLNFGADINGYDNGRLTPLIMAADRNHEKLALLLIERGADVDIQHKQGFTALIDAARNGNENLVQALLEAGADKMLKTKNGWDAESIARHYQHDQVANRIKNHR